MLFLISIFMGRDTIRVSCQLNESLYEVFPRGLRIHAQVPPMTTWLGDMALVEEDSELEHSFLEAIYTGNNPDELSSLAGLHSSICTLSAQYPSAQRPTETLRAISSAHELCLTP